MTFDEWWGSLSWRDRPTDTSAHIVAKKAWDAAIKSAAYAANEFNDPERVENIVSAIRSLSSDSFSHPHIG